MAGIGNNLILITGDEEFLRDRKKKELLAELGGACGFNYNSFDSDNLDLAEIRRLIGTMPLLEDRRRILITDSGLFKKASGDSQSSGREDPVEIFSEIPESTVVIFDEAEVNAGSALYKHLRKNGEIFRFDAAGSKKGRERFDGEAAVRRWAAGTIRENNKEIDGRALDYLLELTGYDMRNLSGELEKLICFAADRSVITVEDVDLIISKTIKDRVFFMIDEKLKGNITGALTVLEELFAIKIQPGSVIYLLARQYDQALLVKDCLSRGMRDDEIIAETGLKNWQLKKIKNQVRSISRSALHQKLEDIADTDLRVKSGRMDAYLAAELLIIG